MARANRPDTVKAAIKEMEKAEDDVRKYLRKARAILNMPQAQQQSNHLLNTPRIRRTSHKCGQCPGCSAKACQACEQCRLKQMCTVRVCHTWLQSPASSVASVSSSASSNRSTRIVSIVDLLGVSCQHYMASSRELLQIITDSGWNACTWPELQHDTVMEAREALGEKVEEAIANLEERADVLEGWNNFDNHGTPRLGSLEVRSQKQCV